MQSGHFVSVYNEWNDKSFWSSRVQNVVLKVQNHVHHLHMLHMQASLQPRPRPACMDS